MIWLPFRLMHQNVAVLSDEHLEDVLQEGLEVLRSYVMGRQFQHDEDQMWQGNCGWLQSYVRDAEMELQQRGYDPDPGPIQAFSHFLKKNLSVAPRPPHWLGSAAFHISHRSQLIRSDPVHYARLLPLNTPLELPFVWP